jgi:hypothetical protein
MSQSVVVFLIAFAFVAITAAWVASDAGKNRIPISKGAKYTVNTGALAWFLTTLLIWIVGFPYYFMRRSDVMRERQAAKVASQAAQVPSTPSPDVEERLRKLNELHQKGMVTAEEYETKRSALLSEL